MRPVSHLISRKIDDWSNHLQAAKRNIRMRIDQMRGDARGGLVQRGIPNPVVRVPNPEGFIKWLQQKETDVLRETDLEKRAELIRQIQLDAETQHGWVDHQLGAARIEIQLGRALFTPNSPENEFLLLTENVPSHSESNNAMKDAFYNWRVAVEDAS